MLMATTDYFIQDSLVLDWIWERVKVDLEDTHIDIMVMNAAYKQGWNMSVSDVFRRQYLSVGWPGSSPASGLSSS